MAKAASQPPSAAFDGKAFARSLPDLPGIYQMLDRQDKVIYVGKARNLKKRVASYFSGKAKDTKTMQLLRQVASMQYSITRTEAEALLLENQLIKKYKPRYNILLKDGKSYPYIYLSTNEDEYPLLEFRRGAKTGKGRYYGPYPSAQAVRHTLNHLQKLFRVRQCSNQTFANRSRPCLQHQIGRCSAPCVGLISPQEYQRQVDYTEQFLQGKSQRIIEQLVAEMEQHAHKLAFEKAAAVRDQIRELKQMQSQQVVENSRAVNLDVFSLLQDFGITVVTLGAIRNGQVLGHRSFFPAAPPGSEPSAILQAFLSQYYLDKPVPETIVSNVAVAEPQLLGEMLSQLAERKVSLVHKPRGQRRRWLELTETNARNALQQRLSKFANWQQKWQTWENQLGLPGPIQRVECFDISHSHGEHTRASCVVFTANGADRANYRNYKISGITGGDDYAAMRAVLEKRLESLRKHGMQHPDVWLIDGGKGQANQARAVLQAHGISDIEIIGIAKDENRTAGQERLFILSQDRVVKPESHSLLSHMVQFIRDEAHRFAISGHRKALARSRKTSPLEGITGVGEQRRLRLLKHFGGLQGLEKAGIDEIAAIPGISRTLAERIYRHLHRAG
jgi:excinuclease ABC subunit C